MKIRFWSWRHWTCWRVGCAGISNVYWVSCQKWLSILHLLDQQFFLQSLIALFSFPPGHDLFLGTKMAMMACF